MIDKPRQKSLLPATDSALGPGDFPLGSIESRVAARAKLDQAENDPPRYFVVRFMHGDRVTLERRIEATGAVQPGELVVRIIHVGGDAPDMFGVEPSQHGPDCGENPSEGHRESQTEKRSGKPAGKKPRDDDSSDFTTSPFREPLKSCSLQGWDLGSKL